MFRTSINALALLAAAPIATPQAGAAERMTWKIRSTHPNIVYLKLFATRTGRAMPDDGQVYVLDDSKWHTITAYCTKGEPICYGASTKHRSAVWGLDRDGSDTCNDCCYSCGAYTRTITLSE